MTVLDNTPRDQYTATGGQVAFSYTFEIAAEGDIAVLQNGVLLSLGAGAGEYAVTGVGSDTGGVVTLVTGATSGDIITLYRDMALERLTSYTNGGDFLAADVNNDYDRLWLALQQNTGTSNRALVAPNTDPTNINMTIPDKATRLGKYLRFNDTTGNPEAGDVAGLYTAAGMNNYNFTGNGSTTAFTLGIAPGAENNTQTYIDGVYQQKDTYTVSGTTLTFSTAPPNLSTIEVMVIQPLAAGENQASEISFKQAGSSVERNVQVKLEESVSVNDFGAVGDGVTDDTAAIQAAIDSLPSVSPPTNGIPCLSFVPGKFYKITDNGTYGLLINKKIIIEGNGAFIDYRGSQRGIRIASDEVVLQNLTIVDYGQSLSVDTSTLTGTGIQILNSQYCRFYNVRVERYAFGFSFYAQNGACANHDCYSCDAVNNNSNVHMEYDDTNYPTGLSYVTKINWYGGSAQILATTFTSVVGSRGINMINPRGDSGYVVDGIVFHGVLTEGYAERKLYTEAKWCAFYDCYWDVQGPTTTDIEFTAGADNNRIAGGSSLDKQVILNNGAGNIIDDKDEYITSAKQTINNQVDISGSNAGQIKFPATQNASADANTLDDYEENLAWSPTISNETNLTSVTVTNGQYVKIGKLVTVNGILSGTVTSGSTLTYLRLVLPFSQYGFPQGVTGTAIASAGDAIGFVRDWSTGSADSVQIVFPASSGINSGATNIDFSFSYIT